MKKVRYLVLPLLFTLLLLVHPVSAVNTGFSTVKMPEKDIETFLSNADISLLTKAPWQRAIECFDVNENGMIAIGQNTLNGKKELCIYSSDGIFQYGYTFNCSGDFGVEWDKENLNIYFVRSDVIVSMDKEGKMTGIAETENTIENNRYLRDHLYSTERTANGTRYVVQNDMGILNWIAFSYSQLVAISPTGEKTLLYDVNSAQLGKTLTICVLAVGFVATAVCLIVLQWKRNGKTDGTEGQTSYTYKTMLPIGDCMDLITRQPWQYQCDLGTPLWYECSVLSPTQLLLTFKGGQFRKAMHTQFFVDFGVEGEMTVVSMRFHKEMFGLPPMTPLRDIDRFMEEKIQAGRS